MELGMLPADGQSTIDIVELSAERTNTKQAA
jgi:hypothetical protein